MRGIDGFEHSDGDAAQAAITTLLSTVFADTRRWARATSREARALVGELGGAALEAMYAGDSAAQRARVLALCRRMDAVADRDDYSSTTAWAAYSSSPSFHWMNVLELALARLLKKRHDYQEPELLALIAAARRHHGISKADVLGHVERHVGDGDCSPALREALESLSERIFKKPLKARAAALLAGAGTRAVAEAQAAQRVYHLRPLTAWSRQAVSDLLAETDEHKASWRRLFRLTLEGASQPRPTQAWQNETNQLLTRIGRQRAAQLLVRWLELTPDGADRAIENENADVLRALAWAASLLGEMPLGGAVELARALGVAASACFAKVYNVGARCARAANACVYALGELGARAADGAARDAAAAALIGLADSVSYSAAQRQIQRTLAGVAAQLDATEDELRQRAVSAAAAAAARPVRAADIDGARALVEREELAAALAALLAMWRGARAASLTEAIVALGAKVAERDAARAVHDELAQGNKPARLETFVRLASGAPTDAAQAATTLGALCEALDRDNGRNLRTQVEALESWPEDPRLALALAPLVTSPTMNDAHAWQGVFNLLRRHGDALALQELEVAADAFGSALRVPVRSRAELAPTISHLRGVLINTPALDDGARAALSRLRDAVSAAGGRSGEGAARRGGGAADERSPEALLAAIYEQPDDDALRRVYADVLSELGDPRGELCAIQLADAPSAAQRKRERELCAAHGRTWLGPLDAVALKQGLEFRRGFPSALRTTGKKLAGARAALAAQEWSTIERLEITDSLMLPEALVRDAPLRSLRVASGLPGDIAAAIFASPTPWRLYELGAALHFDIWEDDDDDERQEAERGRAAVREARGVPALRRLIVERGGGAIERWAWLLESAKLMKQLEFLQLGVSNDAVAGALRYLESHPGLPRVELLETFRSWQLAYEDGALHVTYGGGYAVDDETADKLAQLLAQLPGAVRQLRSLTVELPARAKVSESVLARVREAAIGLGAAQSSLP